MRPVGPESGAGRDGEFEDEGVLLPLVVGPAGHVVPRLGSTRTGRRDGVPSQSQTLPRAVDADWRT